MKKVYMKPMIVIESFQLDASIAGTCRTDAESLGKEYIKLNFTETGCIHDGGFFSSVNACGIDVTGSGGDDNDTICYHGPIAGVVFIHS